MHNKTAAEIAQDLRSGHYSSVEVTQVFLNRVKQLDSQLNSFITVSEELALAHAKAADAQIAAGNAKPLTGVPFAHKDIFCTQGIRTTCGSKMLENFIPPYQSTVAAKLQEAGAICLGKTNMDEFAMGSSNENSFFGPVHNPWAADKVPGGSSGGSAAAIAARLTPIATGTDTGGSIRQPAAFCGITGLKPTYGRVSRLGMIAYASSLDQGGPMARTAEDAALLLQAMAGFDAKDSTSADRSVPDYSASLNQPLTGLRIGLPKEFFGAELDSQMGDLVHQAVKTLESLGAIVKEISLPRTALAVPAYYVIAPAEASTNLSRFDGVRYGYRCENPANLEDLYRRTRAEGFGEEVQRRILVGTYALSAGYYDAYYRKAQQIRRLIRDDFVQAFADVDVIAGPTTPSTAFGINAKRTNPVAMYLEDLYTIPVNLAGLPALSMPAGLIDSMPAGLQLIGNYFDEARLLNIAHQFQRNSEWHLLAPKQFAA